MAYIDKYGVEYSDDQKTLIRCPKDFKGEYVIPKGVTNIGRRAFFQCSGLTFINIPNSVTSIGYSAFESCSSLTSVIIPDSVNSIDWKVFSGCTNLTSATIPDSVTCIGYEAFSGCALTSITIPNSVTSIGDGAFMRCSGLISLIIPQNVGYIGHQVFSHCRRLSSITIPDSVKSIGNEAFSDCTSLTSITIPNSVTSIGVGVFLRCTKLSSIIISNNITIIGWQAFANCTNLTSVAIPDSVTSIGWYAFHGCTSLNTINIPNSVTSIGERAFSGCTNLKSITLPSSVTSIGERAFSGCTNLTSIIISNSAISVKGLPFEYCNNLRQIYVSKGQVDRFLRNTHLYYLSNIIIERDDEELTILSNLATAYERGIGVQQDYLQASLFYAKIAEKGNVKAAYKLAEWYSEGRVIPRDLNKALEYFQQAARAWYMDAYDKVIEIEEQIEQEAQAEADRIAENERAKLKAQHEQEESEKKKRKEEELRKQAEERKRVPYYLFFDTETNGLPRYMDAAIQNSKYWPRLIQLAWILTNKEGDIIKSSSFIIRPDDYTIIVDSEKIHGITMLRAWMEGVVRKEVLQEFLNDLKQASYIVCHNTDFDQRIVSAELYREKMDYKELMNKSSFCTMKSSTDFCAIPNPNTYYGGYKWPSLQELYRKLFNRSFEDAHDALADITATKECYFELKRRGIIKE